MPRSTPPPFSQNSARSGRRRRAGTLRRVGAGLGHRATGHGGALCAAQCDFVAG